MPVICQGFVKKPEDVPAGLAFDRRLYIVRRVFEQSNEGSYVVSLSSRTIVYKGMFLVGQLRKFYTDLTEPDCESAIALVHSRFSTNTTPSWQRAHPNRYILHNGEINTIRGNADKMLAREETMSAPAFSADDITRVLPVVDTTGSDSAMLDNTLEFLMMTEVFETYASPETKAMYMQDGGIMMQNGYVDGKLVGLALPQGYQDFIPIVSIRSDWLEECGLDAPKTMDELWNIAKTFKEKNVGGNCSIGIGMTKNVLDLLTPTIGLLNGYHAYYNVWIEQDGELVNSTIQPEMKEALAALHDKYEEGLIDPEFGTKENAQLMEDVMAGRCGIVVSHYCAPFDLLNAVADGQKWEFFSVPSADDDPVLAQFSLAFSGALCVSAACEHPEAMIEMLNIFTKYVAEDPQTYNDNAVRNFAYPTITSAISGNNDIHKEYLEFLETGVTPVTTTQGYESTVEAAEKYRLNQDIDGYTMWGVFGPEGTEVQVSKAIENNAYMIDAFTGAPTASMIEYSSVLKTLTEQIVTDIICGVKSVDAFDAFVESWKLNGGDAIAAEVNAWYQAKTSN